MRPTNAAKVVAYIPAAALPGFALPVFREPSSIAFSTQEVDELDGRIVSFRPIPNLPSEAQSLGECPLVEIGHPQVYVFADQHGSAWCGTLSELADLLRAYAESNLAQPDVCVQIYELIGTPEEKKVARLELQERILRELGQASERYFQNSALQAELWSALIKRAPNREAMRRILNVRNRLIAYVDNNGRLKLDLAGLSESDLEWAQREEIFQYLTTTFDLPTRPVEEPRGGAAPPSEM